MSQEAIANNICLSAVGHDPDGRWVDHLTNSNDLLIELYGNRIVSFSDRTHSNTVDAALSLGWRVDVEPLTVGSARFAVIRRGLETDCSFINLWDGDRILHASTYGVDELKDIVGRIPQYDFFVAGASKDAIATHQSSMTSWEGVKSWALGHYLGISGDIANRGCFGFSREYANFLVQHEDSKGDDTDALFAILPLAFRQLIAKDQLSATGRETIGYDEYFKATSYEDWMFEGLTRKESAARKNTHRDFTRRAESVLRAIALAQRIGERYDLGFPPQGEETMESMIKRLAQQL